MMGPRRAVGAFWLVAFVLLSTGVAFFSFDGYSLLSNTTSHLGAQGSPHAWVMNLVFLGMGATAIWITYATRIRYDQVIGGVFGGSLMVTAVFRHAPLMAGKPADVLQDQLHSIVASATGLSFILLAMGHGVMSAGRQRTGGFALAAFATLISVCMAAFPSIAGLLQRVLFVVAFGWLFFVMQPPHQRQVSRG